MTPAAQNPARLDRGLLLFCAAGFGATILYPSLRLLWSAAREWQWDSLLHGAGVRAVVNTLTISFASVATAGFLGAAMAFLLNRFDFPGRRTLAGLAYLPFALPPLVGVISFYYLVGPDGVVTRVVEEVTGAADAALRGPWGILLIHTYSFYVFFYAMVAAALERFDMSQIEAARTLGAGRFRTFRLVTLPLLRPALLGASLLTFMSSGASFSAPLIFGGGRFPMLSLRIFEAEVGEGNHAAALTLTVVLALISLLGVLVFRGRRSVAGTASKGVRRALRSRGGRIAAGVASLCAMATLLTPHAVILWLSFVDHQQWHEEILPTAFTLENYRLVFSDPGAFAPIRNSVWMSALAAGATLVAALPAAYLIGRRRPGGRWLNVLVMIPWALPGTVIAMNLLEAFRDPWVPWAFGVLMLPFAYFVRNVPLLTRMASAAIEPFDASLIEAGRTLGATRAYCFARIVLPLLAPAIVAGTALVFTTSLGEFVASILLYLPANKPISMGIFEAWRGSGIGAGFAYGVLLMVLVSATFLIAQRLGSRAV